MNNAPLIYLLYLKMRGGVLRRVRSLQSPRGLAFLALTVMVFTVILGPLKAFLASVGGDDGSDQGLATGGVQSYMPIFMLCGALLTIVTSPGPAIHFSDAERVFLLAGPFSRSALVYYKIGVYSLGSLISAVIITFMLQLPPHRWLAPFLGSFFALMFFQLFGAVVNAAFQLWSHKYPSARRVVLFAGSMMIVVLAWPLAYSTTAERLNKLLGSADSLPGTLLLFPFHIFTRAIFAERVFPDLCGWLVGSLAIVGTLAIALVRLDGRMFLLGIETQERSPGGEQSERRSVFGSVFRALKRFRFGPIAWRQFLHAYQTAPKVFLALAVVAAAGGPLLFRGLTMFSFTARVGVMAVFVVFLLPKALVFDFRNDIDALRLYKRLPIPPMSIALGQLAVPALLTTAIEWIFVASSLPLLSPQRANTMLQVAAFLPPFNVILFSLENIMILLFPTHLTPIGRIDFEFFGRNILELFVKSAMLSCCVIVAFNVAKSWTNLVGWSFWQYEVAAWLALSAIAWFFVACLARVFAKTEPA